MESDESVYGDAGMLRIKFGTSWKQLDICSEVKVIATARGYAPGLVIGHDGVQELMLIGAASLTRPLEALRLANNGKLKGLTVRIRKAAAHSTAPYECEQVGD